MSGVIGLGPLEENETTLGAMTSFQVSLNRIVAKGFLNKGLVYLINKIAKSNLVTNIKEG